MAEKLTAAQRKTKDRLAREPATGNRMVKAVKTEHPSLVEGWTDEQIAQAIGYADTMGGALRKIGKVAAQSRSSRLRGMPPGIPRSLAVVLRPTHPHTAANLGQFSPASGPVARARRAGRVDPTSCGSVRRGSACAPSARPVRCFAGSLQLALDRHPVRPRYCAGDVAGERGNRASRLRGVESQRL